jgi:hypothetical protein
MLTVDNYAAFNRPEMRPVQLKKKNRFRYGMYVRRAIYDVDRLGWTCKKQTRGSYMKVNVYHANDK